jgi:arginase family enzyme
MCIMTVTELMPPGTDGIIKKIRETVGDGPVYLSIDVGVAVTFVNPLLLIKYT